MSRRCPEVLPIFLISYPNEETSLIKSNMNINNAALQGKCQSAKSEYDAATMMRYERFLNANYSPNAYLFVIATYFLFSEFIFHDYAVLSAPEDITCVSMVTMALRFVAFCFVSVIWLVKTPHGAPSQKWVPKQLVDALPFLQGLYPVLMNAAFAIYFISDRYTSGRLDRVKMNESAVFFATVGLKGYSLVTYLLLRDTNYTATLVSFWFGVIVHLCLVVESGYPGELISFGACSALFGAILYDSQRQNRAIFDLVSTLQTTIEENERLAVEAQALELRAMIGNVAHDLKTPLTSGLSALECMYAVVKDWRTTLASEGETAFLSMTQLNLDVISSCLKTMEGINSFMTMTINRCVDYTKVSKGVKLVPQYQTVCLKTEMNMAVQMINDMNSSIGIVVHPWSSDICTHLITDKQWLLENLICLLSNAVKYSNRGSVDLFVTLQDNPQHTVDDHDASATATQMLCVEVQDTGVGLSDEAMANLFAPFKQAQRLAGGTGLGLYSLAMRMEALHGQYGVRKRPDGTEGSLFWYTIPYRPDEMSAASVEDTFLTNIAAVKSSTALSPTLISLHPQAQSAEACAGLNVMVVDDAPLILKMAKALLHQKGHRVTEQAVNGADALEKLLSRYNSSGGSTEGGDEGDAQAQGTPPFDAVLMDLQMPVLDGIEAIRRLRAAEQTMREAEADAELASHPPGATNKVEVEVEVKIEVEVDPEGERSVTKIRAGIETAGARAGAGSRSIFSAGSGAGTAGVRYHQYVIALSANSDTDTRQAALNAGADAFLPKPFRYEGFMNLMVLKNNL